MTIPNRTVSMKEVFAKDALTTIPTSPVVGTSYRNTALTATEVKNGWPFKEIVDSAKFNEYLYEQSTITNQVEKYGFLPWSNLTDYVAGSVSLGSDGNLYQAVQATGPSTTAYDPVNDTSNTYWKPYYQTIMSTMLSLVYPVGSIYIGTQATCPMAALISGSTWEKVEGGKALWISDNSHNPNTTISAGLPNITGKSSGFAGENTSTGQNGAIKTVINGNGYAGGSWQTYKGIEFDASLSNAIYGGSDTVQPPAYVVNVWRRTA